MSLKISRKLPLNNWLELLPFKTMRTWIEFLMKTLRRAVTSPFNKKMMHAHIRRPRNKKRKRRKRSRRRTTWNMIKCWSNKCTATWQLRNLWCSIRISIVSPFLDTISRLMSPFKRAWTSKIPLRSSIHCLKNRPPLTDQLSKKMSRRYWMNR